MTTISYPAKGTGGFPIDKWAEVFEGFNGILNDYTGNSLAMTRIDASNVARIAPGQVRVGGYVLEVTANDDLVVSTSAATYYIWASYDPALNVGTTADPLGPCRLGISTGAPSTSGGKAYCLLYQIVRSASQALTAATVKDFRVWQGPSMHIPATTTIPSELLTDPETPPVGFQFPVGARITQGSATPYTHIKSTSGLKWESSAPIPTQQVFTSNGTWTKPAGAKWVRIQVQAGGGGGGGAATTGAGESSAGSGGQGGGYGESILAATALGATVAVTVGAAGSVSDGGDGNAGGNSSFGSHVTAVGGSPGSASAASGSPVVTSGAQGTQTIVGQIQIPGGGGGALARITANDGIGGMGGGSALGQGGGGRGGFNAGFPGRGYGGGGGGAALTSGHSSQAGGAGAAGVVVVTTYY